MALILVVGLLVDLLWIFMIQTVPFSDFLYYHELANQIAQGGSWGDTYTSVGYPIFLAIFYKIFGSSIWVAKFVNIALSTLNNLLVYYLLKRVALSEKARKILFLLFVLFPMNVYYNSLLASEILFTTGFLLVLNITLREIRWKYLWLGLLTGLLTMIKPFFPAMALAIFLVEFLTERKFLQSLKRAGIVLLLALVVIAPWLYRNTQLMGEFSYVSNNGGIVLYINNNSQNTYGAWMPAEEVEDSLVNTPEYLEANRVQKNKMLSAAAKEWIAEHPLEFISLGFKRLGRTFLLYGDLNVTYNEAGLGKFARDLLFIMAELVRAPIFLLGCLGILRTSMESLRKLASSFRRVPQRWDKSKLTFLITFYMFAGVYFITEGQSRYAFPTVVILLYFALEMVQVIYPWVKQKREG